MKTEEPSGVVSINTALRPAVPADSLVLLNRIGVTDISLVAGYKIKSKADQLEVVNLAKIAASRIKSIKEGYKEEKAKADGAHATLCDHEKEDLAGWVQIRKMADSELERWDAEQTRLRRAEEQRIAAAQAAEAQRVREEAAALQREADAKVAELRKAGEMRAAKEVVAEVAQQVQDSVMLADAIADVGIVLPAEQRISGFGSSNKWKGREVVKEDDPDWGIMQAMRAIVEGSAPLRYRTPVRGEEPQMLRVIEFSDVVLNEIGNRLRKQDIGLPGAEGYTKWSSRISGNDAPAAAPLQSGISEDDGWESIPNTPFNEGWEPK